MSSEQVNIQEKSRPTGAPLKSRGFAKTRKGARDGSKRQGNEGAPPRGGISQDGRTPFTIRFPVSSTVKSVLERAYPEYHFTYVSKSPPHDHPLLALGRTLGEMMLKKRCFGKLDSRQPILDVGLGLRNVGNKAFHGCECSTAPHILVKLRDVRRRRYPQLDFLNRQRQTDDKYTWCTHNAVDCDCFGLGQDDVKPRVALFTHSIYYNDIADVARILLKTTHLRGYAIFHKFIGTKGQFYVHDGTPEAVWIREGSTISMSVRGNMHTYKHDAADWLAVPVHHLEIGGTPYNLVIKALPFDDSGVNHVVQMDLVAGYPYDYPEPVDYEHKVFVDGVCEYVPRIYGGYFTVNPSVVIHDSTGHKFPVEMAGKLLKFLLHRELDGETWEVCLKRLSSLCNPNLYKNLSGHFTAHSLSVAAPYVATYVIMTKLAMTKELSRTHTWRLWLSKAIHNRAIRGESRETGLIIAGLVGLVLYFAGLGLVRNWAVIYQFIKPWVLNSSFYGLLFYVLGPATAFFIIPRLAFGADDMFVIKSLPPDYWLLACGYIFYTCLLYIIVKSIIELTRRLCRKRTGPDKWKQWVSIYHELRESNIYEGPIPHDASVNCLETLVDPNEYPTRPNTSLDVLEHQQTKIKPGMVPVGIVFCNAVPIVHSTSQHNYIVAAITRVLYDVGEPDDGAWKRLDALTRGLLSGLQAGQYGPEPIDQTNLVGKIWEAPTYDDWIKRFTPQKRTEMYRWRERLECGWFSQADTHYKAFVKREKVMGITFDEFTPIRPRMIQGCSKFEKAATGHYFYTLSKALKFIWPYKNHVWVASGATADEINQWINYHVERLGGLDNVVFIGTDFSKYDLTQGKECKSREHQWYKDLGFMELPGARNILKARQNLTVYGSGTKMKYKWRRQSGSCDTTVGNDKNTAKVIVGSFRHAGVNDEDRATAVAGDDNLSIVMKSSFHVRIIQLIVFFVSSLGMKLKVQHSEHPSKVEFLSCRFWPVAGGKLAIGKKPGRVLAKMGWMLYKPCRTMEAWQRLFKGSLLSYKATCMHVPFLRKYLTAMFEQLKNIDADYDHEALRYRLTGNVTHQVCRETFDAFESVYGLTAKDESIFATRLNIKPPYMLNSTYVEKMYAVDAEMDSLI